jgi:hypothetical protein
MRQDYNNYFRLSVRKRAFMGKRREIVLRTDTQELI